ncbi:MAG TPA: cysteine desulfurase family protein [Polyangium sp.]|nr:cysteine desulfurase family protein [Polyangium sp.]
MSQIYLDWNATTPPHPDVVTAMIAAARDAWGNPASVHATGRRARARVEDAREAIGSLVGLDPRDIYLTSGGTEANNLALWHAFADGLSKSNDARQALVVSRAEHPSIVKFAEHLAERGVLVEWVGPDVRGRVDPAAIVDAMDRASATGTIVRLVALQAVNHETGVIQPVPEVAEVCRRRKALLFVDAVQAVGKLPRDTYDAADLVSLAAHKIRGPKGVGALATRSTVHLRRMLFGGAQEKGLRPGTQDPVACAGFAVAAERAKHMPTRYAAIAPIRDQFELDLARIATDAGIVTTRNGEGERAPHVTNISFRGWIGPELCAALDLEGVAVSSGSACSAGTAEPSPVLESMVGRERALSAVRISLGEDTTPDDLREALVRWQRVLARAATQPRVT